jgi:F-type H+-transporting ATPase subunit delta
LSKASTLSSARRYASAFLRAAVDTKNTAVATDACRGLQKLVQQSPMLANVIAHQGLPSQQKGAALLEIAKKQQVPDIVINLIRLLERNRRLYLLPVVLTQIDKDADALAGVVDAVATTPLPLTAEQVQALQKTITDSTNTLARLHTKVDPHLLDGITLRIGGRFYDASGLTKIRRLRQAMEVL